MVNKDSVSQEKENLTKIEYPLYIQRSEPNELFEEI